LHQISGFRHLLVKVRWPHSFSFSVDFPLSLAGSIASERVFHSPGVCLAIAVCTHPRGLVKQAFLPPATSHCSLPSDVHPICPAPDRAILGADSTKQRWSITPRTPRAADGTHSLVLSYLRLTSSSSGCDHHSFLSRTGAPLDSWKFILLLTTQLSQSPLVRGCRLSSIMLDYLGPLAL